MKRFEYKTISVVCIHESIDAIDSKLKELGKEGRELVTEVTDSFIIGRIFELGYILK